LPVPVCAPVMSARTSAADQDGGRDPLAMEGFLAIGPAQQTKEVLVGRSERQSRGNGQAVPDPRRRARLEGVMGSEMGSVARLVTAMEAAPAKRIERAKRSGFAAGRMLTPSSLPGVSGVRPAPSTSPSARS
jgi:hypothetical protein